MSSIYPNQSLTDLLSQLVGNQSVNPVYGGSGEENVARFVEDWLRGKGVPVQKQPVVDGRQNIIARIGPSGAPALLLEAHMDTVGVSGWARGNPFELSERNGRLYGRGSCDTKASLACFMATLAHFHRHPERLNRALVLAASVDEESEQLGAYALAKRAAELGIAWAITGEPTSGNVVSRHKGVGRYSLNTKGKAAHGSTPELGENAIFKAARICGRLEELGGQLAAKPWQREIERGTLNIGKISGGIGFNVVPDACSIDIDRRYGSGETAESARLELEAIGRSERESALHVFLERPALKGEHSKEFVRDMLEAGDSPDFVAEELEVAYMTNAVAYEEVGIPAVVFGPGDIAQAHKNDEYIEVGEMERCFEILKRLLSKR